jgi:nitrite reductase/ring-hydroxylating ferredoxin subunit
MRGGDGEGWQRAMPEADLVRSASVRVADREIALFRWEGSLYALDDVCSHEFSRLSEGEIWDGEVYCPKHGSRFDLRTGAVTGFPATLPVAGYDVKVEEGWIWVRPR